MLRTMLAGLAMLLTANAASAQTPAAAAYIARGQEPGWRLIVSERAITLNTDSGARFEATTPSARKLAHGRRYDVVFGTRPVRIAIEARLCHDSMSGMPHPDRVTIRGLDGVLKGCGGAPRDLLGTDEWIVTRIGPAPVIASAPATLQFLAEGGVVGKGSCNRFRAGFTLTGEGLAITAPASTMMACPPDAMRQEQAFLKLLESVIGFDIRSDGSLVLKGRAGETIVARRS